MAPTPAKLKQVAAALKKLEELDLTECFDPFKPSTRPSQRQQEFLEEFGTTPIQIIRAGNQSGKTSTVARLCAWLLKENHPYWKRPKEWANEPLLMLVCGRTGKQIEESLLRRISAFFPDGSLKEVRSGSQIQKVVHRDTGNTIVFQTYENLNQARERVQSYTAHFVWVDEMPASFSLFDELLRRVQAKSGFFAATFTPLIISNDIRKFCDTLEEKGIGKTYRMHMFDNPIYADPKKQESELAKMSTLSDHMKNARLSGEWMMPENSVYYFDSDTMIRDLPEDYSPFWRHVESFDPGLDSAAGLTILAEDPRTALWYVVKSIYIKGVYVPSELVSKVMQITSKYNIVRRVADAASTWYIYQAQSMGLNYVTPWDKNNRRDDMIKNLQAALGTKVFITPDCGDLTDEFLECRWSETTEGKIVKSSKFHLLDSIRYATDCLPKPEVTPVTLPWHQELLRQHYAVKKREAAKESLSKSKARGQTVGFRPRGRW